MVNKLYAFWLNKAKYGWQNLNAAWMDVCGAASISSLRVFGALLFEGEVSGLFELFLNYDQASEHWTFSFGFPSQMFSWWSLLLTFRL